MKPPRLSPAARQDMIEAAVWYAEQRVGLDAEFLHEVDSILFQIGSSPDIFPFVHGELRRALVRRFPYSVIFVDDESTIGVVAIIHTSRDPEAWRRRV